MTRSGLLSILAALVVFVVVWQVVVVVSGFPPFILPPPGYCPSNSKHQLYGSLL